MLKLPIPQLHRARNFIETYGVNGIFEGKVQDREHMARIFEQHTEAVKDHVLAERLLIYDVREGWEPLCNFLNVPVPEEPFPRLNRRESMQEFARQIFQR